MLRGMRRYGSGAVVAMVLAAALLGCSGGVGKASSTTSMPPSGAGDDVRRAIAIAAAQQYKKYFAVNTRILHGSAVSVADLKAYLTPTNYAAERASIEKFQGQKRKVLGATSTRNFTVQRFDNSAKTLSAYVCVDNRNSTIVDSEGRNVTPTTRFKTATILLSFDVSGTTPLISKSDVWAGSSVC